VEDEKDNEEPWREDRQRHQARHHCPAGHCEAMSREGRKHYSSEEKIRIVLDGLRGEDSIAELCRREGISQGIYYKWSKDFMEAGKKRLAGDTARAANTDEVKALRREAKDLKEVVAEQTLELRLLKKSMIEDGGDHE
jgi:transposase